MRAFEYARPSSIDHALDLLDADGAAVLAGGSDLLALVKDDLLAPRRLVGVAHLPELRGIEVRRDDGGDEHAWIGAGTTLADLADSPVLAERLPALAAVAGEVGGPQVREAATLGGNLCQWPRCAYFRTGFGLLAQQGKTSLVRAGDNRRHAIFSTDGAALYVHPSTVAPVLQVLEARVEIAGPKRRRDVSVEDFLRVPRRDDEAPVDLRPREIVTGVRVPLRAGRWTGFHEVRQKAAMDWPLVTAAVSFQREGGSARSPRVVLGHVAPVPWRATAAERRVDGSALDEKSLASVAEAATEGAKPLSGNAYKLRLVRAATRRAFEDALDRGARS